MPKRREDTSLNIKCGIKGEFESGTFDHAECVCFGYKLGDNDKFVTDEPDLEIVWKIFEMSVNGYSLRAIVNCLYENKTLVLTGKACWRCENINKSP